MLTYGNFSVRFHLKINWLLEIWIIGIYSNFKWFFWLNFPRQIALKMPRFSALCSFSRPSGSVSKKWVKNAAIKTRPLIHVVTKLYKRFVVAISWDALYVFLAWSDYQTLYEDFFFWIMMHLLTYIIRYDQNLNKNAYDVKNIA